MTRPLSIPILTFVGMIAALVLGLALGTLTAPTSAPPVPLKTNMELLGEVTTVIDPAEPLTVELTADDKRRAAREKDAWQ